MERSEDCNSSSALCSCGSVHIKNALIYDSDKRSFFKGGINAKDGVITGFDEESDAYDAKGMYIIPGLVDVHTHGRGGFDYNSATLDQMKKMKKLYAEMGVTTVIPTLASAPFDKLIESIDNIKAAGYRGVHIEGRYLNPKKRGAHRLELLSKLDPEEISILINHAKPLEVHVSAAYELDESGDFLKTIIKLGGTAGLAHTEATVDEALNAVENGVTSFTHLFNAMPPLHHRNPGAVCAGLISDAYTELICDGFHLAPQTVKLVCRAKAPEKVVLITDSMEGTGCEDGEYSIGGCKVFLKGGKAYTDEGAIAGSTLELFDGVKNYMSFCGMTFEHTINQATINPAKMIGIDKLVGSLEKGKAADFCLVSGVGGDLKIEKVFTAEI